MSRFKKAATVLLLLSVPCLAAIVWIRWPAARTDRSAGMGLPTGTGVEPAAGRDLQLEIFDPSGNPRWRLYMRRATVDARDLKAEGITAAGTAGRMQFSLRAPAMEYLSDRSLLRFTGGVRLEGPAFVFTSEDLVWDGCARSYAADGGYTMAKGESIMSGRRLLASEDFQDVKALGPVKIRIGTAPAALAGTEGAAR